MPFLGLTWSAVFAVGMTAMAPPAATGESPPFPTRTQTVELKEGWNAVFLEVEPADPSPTEIFADSPVDVVAQFLRPVRTAQFATDPGEELANDESWGVWYGPDREESLLSNLFALHSHTALLVHSRKAFSWTIAGQVFLKRIIWKPDSFNLIGFPVDPEAAPTFAQFFKGVPAHEAMPVFRLVEGRWRRVDRPAETLIRRGEAYWVYSRGGSDFQGPVEVRLPYGDHLRFGGEQSTAALALHNRSADPAGVTIQQVGGVGVPLDFIFKGVLESGVERFAARLPQSYTMPPMEPGVSGSVILRVHDLEGLDGGGAGLLKISSDSGTAHWIAVYAEPAGDS